MRKFVQSLATLALMGLPAWVVLAGLFGGGASSLTVRLEEPGVVVTIGDLVFASNSGEIGPVELSPGEHRVVVSRGNETLFETTVRLEQGDRQTVHALWLAGQTRAEAARGLAEDQALVAAPGLAPQAADLETGLELEGHQGTVTDVAFSGVGRVVSLGMDKTLRLWNLGAEGEGAVVPVPANRVQGMALLGDGGRVAVLNDEGVLHVFDAKTGEPRAAISTGDASRATCMAASSDGRLVAIGNETGAVRIFDLETQSSRARIRIAPATPGSLAFSPDGGGLLIGQVGSPRVAHAILVFDVASSRVVRALRGHKAPVWGVAYLPDGKRIVSVGADETLRLWNLDDGQELKSFQGDDGGFQCVAVTPDGRHAVTGSGYHWSFTGGFTPATSYGVSVWDLETGRRVGRHETVSPVRCLALSPSGDRALAGGEDSVLHTLKLPRFGASAPVASTGAEPADPMNPPTSVRDASSTTGV